MGDRVRRALRRRDRDAFAAGRAPAPDPPRAPTCAGARHAPMLTTRSRSPTKPEGRMQADDDFAVSPSDSSLADFVAEAAELSPAERGQIVDQALLVIEQLYVHLPLKRAMHAVDPVQRLKPVRHHAGPTDRAAVPRRADLRLFASLRGLHTLYMLPAPYKRRAAVLPFLIERCFAGDRLPAIRGEEHDLRLQPPAIQAAESRSPTGTAPRSDERSSSMPSASAAAISRRARVAPEPWPASRHGRWRSWRLRPKSGSSSASSPIWEARHPAGVAGLRLGPAPVALDAETIEGPPCAAASASIGSGRSCGARTRRFLPPRRSS